MSESVDTIRLSFRGSVLSNEKRLDLESVELFNFSMDFFFRDSIRQHMRLTFEKRDTGYLVT